MRFILLLFNMSLIFAVIDGSFVNPYPRYKSFSDGGDPGEALYLTKYIESGDIGTVSFGETEYIRDFNVVFFRTHGL